MPSFFEIPLALSLLAGGVSAGAALAVLIAGPAMNRASLLVIARGKATGRLRCWWRWPLG